MSFKGKFTTIKEGFSTNRRIPRLGKIRLGEKVENAAGKTYPRETPYFVIPDEVKLVYGPHPTTLDVMLLSEDPEVIFPQKLSRYGSSKGLVCHGDSVNAERLNPETKKWEPRSCPCEFRRTAENPKGDCTETANLMVVLHKVNMGGVYQIGTGSYNSTVDVNSGIEYVKAMIGRISMIPLKLKRVERDTFHGGKRTKHYTLALTLDADVEGINKLREDNSRVLSSAKFQIEGPVETNPAYDDPDVIDVEGEETQAEDPQAPLPENVKPGAGKPARTEAPPQQETIDVKHEVVKAETSKAEPAKAPQASEPAKPYDPREETEHLFGRIIAVKDTKKGGKPLTTKEGVPYCIFTLEDDEDRKIEAFWFGSPDNLGANSYQELSGSVIYFILESRENDGKTTYIVKDPFPEDVYLQAMMEREAKN